MFPNGHTPQKTSFAEYVLFKFDIFFLKITFRDFFFLLYHVLNHIHFLKKSIYLCCYLIYDAHIIYKYTHYDINPPLE